MLVKLIYLDDNLEPKNTYWLKASNVFHNQVTGLLDIRDRRLDSQSINININHTPVILYINGVLEIGQPKTDLESPPKQAQKQEKLLELYKELSVIRDDMLYCYEVVDFIAYNTMEKKETQLEKQIKELENE